MEKLILPGCQYDLGFSLPASLKASIRTRNMNTFQNSILSDIFSNVLISNLWLDDCLFRSTVVTGAFFLLNVHENSNYMSKYDAFFRRLTLLPVLRKVFKLFDYFTIHLYYWPF